MKVCFNCYAELEDTDMFCSNCGKKYVSKNGVIICPMCKSELIKNQLLCDNCYNEIQINTKELMRNIEKSEEAINGDYKTIDRYVGLLERLTHFYEELYRYASYIPKQIDISPKTFEEYKKITYESLEDVIDHRIDTYYFQLHRFGDADMLVELDIMKNEMLRAAKRYPNFEKYLSTERIDNIISSYEKKENK